MTKKGEGGILFKSSNRSERKKWAWSRKRRRDKGAAGAKMHSKMWEPPRNGKLCHEIQEVFEGKSEVEKRIKTTTWVKKREMFMR